MIQNIIWTFDDEFSEAARNMSQSYYDKLITEEVLNCVYDIRDGISLDDLVHN